MTNAAPRVGSLQRQTAFHKVFLARYFCLKNCSYVLAPQAQGVEADLGCCSRESFPFDSFWYLATLSTPVLPIALPSVDPFAGSAFHLGLPLLFAWLLEPSHFLAGLLGVRLRLQAYPYCILAIKEPKVHQTAKLDAQTNSKLFHCTWKIRP